MTSKPIVKHFHLSLELPTTTSHLMAFLPSEVGKIKVAHGQHYSITPCDLPDCIPTPEPAAPEIVELLEWAYSELCQQPAWCESNHPVRKPKHDKIRAAIAKAKREAEANARFIAAAPDMEAVLERLYHWNNLDVDARRKLMTDARVAIAKAKGETPNV